MTCQIASVSARDVDALCLYSGTTMGINDTSINQEGRQEEE